MKASELNTFLDSFSALRSGTPKVVRRRATNRQVLALDSALLDGVESGINRHCCDWCGSALRDDQLHLPCPSCGASHDGSPVESEAPFQCDQPSRPDRTELVGMVWEWLDAELRSWSEGLRGSSTRNDRLEAWLSDVALAVCSLSEAELDDLADCCLAEQLTTPWKSRFAILAFRRRVNGWDVGECLSTSGDVPKAIISQRLQTEEFWDKVPQHGLTEEGQREDAPVASEVFAGFLADSASCDNDSLLRSIVAVCEVPDFSGREQAKSAGMSKSQHFNNLAKLRTRLSCFGLLELALEG